MPALSQAKPRISAAFRWTAVVYLRCYTRRVPSLRRTRLLVWLSLGALALGLAAADGSRVRFVFRGEIASVLPAVAERAPTDLPSDTEGAARWTAWVRARDAA